MATNKDVIEKLEQLPTEIGAVLAKALAEHLTAVPVPATVKVAKPKPNKLAKYEANVRKKAEAQFKATGKPLVIYQTINGSGIMKIYYKTEEAFKTVPAEKILHVFAPVGM